MSDVQKSAEGEMTLARIGCGRRAELRRFCMDSREAERLRELGLCEGRCVAVLQSGRRFVLRVDGCRIGLHHDLAACVLAADLGPAPEAAPSPAPFFRLARRVRALLAY
jgi:Fe2+ transport system protein FeoA